MLIQLCGSSGSGKSTVGAAIGRHFQTVLGYTVVHISFAAQLKHEVWRDYGVRKDGADGGMCQFNKLPAEVPDSIVARFESLVTGYHASEYTSEKKIIAKLILQYYGTDVVREHIDRNYWIECVRNKIARANKAFEERLLIINDDYRFIDEQLPDLHSIRIRVRNSKLKEVVGKHKSENVDQLAYNFVYDNEWQSDEDNLPKLLETLEGKA